MTKKSNDERKEELNISDAPIKDRHHHTSRGYLAHDSGSVDDDAINEDLHNVIAAYWKDRQKPGFVGYKDSLEYEEEEVRVEDDTDISFLKTAKKPEVIYQEAKDSHKKPEKAVESKDAVDTEIRSEEPVTKPAEFVISTEKLTEARAWQEEIPEETEVQTEQEPEIDTPVNESVVIINATEQETNAQMLERQAIKPNPLKVDPIPQKEHKQQVAPTKDANRKRKKKKTKKKGPGRVLKWIFSILLLLVIGGTVTFGIMRYVGWKNSNRTNDSGEDISTPEGVISENGGKTVVYKGVTYNYNEDLSTVLFIGVDKEKYEENGVSGEAGQADTVILTVVNQKNGETRMIPLSRSTMVAIDQYNADGSYWKQDILQLAVSFAYGKNIDENCKNVAKAVSRILYGMPVHRFVTMDLSAIPQLNDAVGGVTVNCLEDMTDVNESWTEGAEITLHGKEAENYVRHRKTSISDESQDNNAPRMERQKQYLNNFIRTLLTNMKGDVFVPLRLYREVGDDIYSDVTTSEIVYYTSMLVSKGFNNSILSIKGSVKHNAFTEFYPDEEQLYQLILDTFYERQ
ncbi:MAG: LCP family protein, partial [Eubacterium sp.]|nr:LCP family protein [Eubacterium sp.]